MVEYTVVLVEFSLVELGGIVRVEYSCDGEVELS